MIEALDEALTDPTDPERYTLATRAEDVKILWDKPILVPIESGDEEIESETQTTRLDSPQSKAKQNSITTYERTLSTLPEILKFLEGQGVKKAKIRVEPRNLEDLFLRAIQRMEPLLKQLGEAQQAFKAPFASADVFQAQKDYAMGFISLLLDFNASKGREDDTALELLLFLHRQQPDSKLILSLIKDQEQARIHDDFAEMKEQMKSLLLPRIDS